MDSYEKLKETKIPPIDAFFNKLNNRSLSPVDYAKVNHLWNTLGIQTLGEFARLYLAR